MSEGLGRSTQPRGFIQSEKSKAHYWTGEGRGGQVRKAAGRLGQSITLKDM